MKTCSLLILSFFLAATARSQSQPDYLPEVRFHLTARPWQPINQPKTELLDRVDNIIHALASLQHYNASNAGDANNGAIIDPYNKAEWQYSTPYFTFAAATALSQGRASDLITQAVRAMDRATLEVSSGTVPQKHGEFVVAPIIKALRLFQWMQLQGLYADSITADKLATWKSRMTTKRSTFMNMAVLQNWRTYASKGEWLRQQDGLISDGVSWIESNWLTSSGGNQRARFRRDVDQYGISPHYLIYHDDTGDPETFAYNGGAAGNLLDILENGYNGASASDMRQMMAYNIRSNLLYMGASGEAPAGGRSGDHVWNDIVYANDYEMMAEIALRNGDTRSAGQYRRAAELAFKSAWRFQQERGWFSVTKNLFHPSLKNHYATYSALTNYNGYTEIHTSEAFFSRKSNIAEQPTPAEIGGYCVKLDPSYENTFINAGGMQAQLCTHGTENDAGSTVLWHTLGIPRFSRTGWDSRLGPADGFVKLGFSAGTSFCPVFLENGTWKNICTLPSRFGGSFTPTFVHPLLVRGNLVIAPKSGQAGPTFTMAVTLTPDGALIDTAETSGTSQFGIIWPLLEYDGRTMLVKNVSGQVASTAYPKMSGTMITTQAETAMLSGSAVIATNHNNYTGTGFLDFPATGGMAQWNGVNGGDGGATVIGFRYALGISSTSNRTAALTVNGTTSNITFDSTVSWDDWHQLYAPVTLASGTNNVIKLQSTGQDCASIDELRVYPAVAGAAEMDQQNFIALKSDHQLAATASVVRTGYGDVRPIRVTGSNNNETVQTFVYPRSDGDPSAESVRTSFTRNGDDFSSVLGRVKGNLYVGRTSAGGQGSAIDLDNDGTDDVTVSRACNFILQLSNGKVTALETDSAVTATVGGQQINLAAFTPVTLPPRSNANSSTESKRFMRVRIVPLS
jgi:hypothetical protein